MLIKYIRYEGQLVGCVVALDDKHMGWSQCHSKLDNFSKSRALEIAMGRAVKGTKKKPRKYDIYGDGEKEDLIGKAMEEIEYRAKRYFKRK